MYAVKKTILGFAVVNLVTGLAQSMHPELMKARKVAAKLNADAWAAMGIGC